MGNSIRQKDYIGDQISMYRIIPETIGEMTEVLENNLFLIGQEFKKLEKYDIVSYLKLRKQEESLTKELDFYKNGF